MLDITATREVLRISSQLVTTSPITIAYRGHIRDVAPGQSFEFELLKPEERDRDENRPAKYRSVRNASAGGNAK